MLSTLHLQNFRGFSDHRLWLRPLAVVVEAIVALLHRPEPQQPALQPA
ncbi:MAG: hypothetical protein ACKPHU_35665 [Planctomycetaceae bacterium]